MREITHVDLFAGAGGIATGFHAAGLRTVAAVEYVDSCVETYSSNHPEVPVIHKDVRKVDLKTFKALGIEKVDLVSAGMPCETFSTAGSTSRSFYDHRQLLYKEAIRIANFLSAETIIFENVPALLTKRAKVDGDELIIDLIISDLRKNKFRFVEQMVLNSSEFGVPQSRDRLFIIASKLPINFARPKANSELFTVNHAFADLPKVRPNSLGTGRNAKFTNKVNKYTELMKNLEFWRTNLPISEVPTHHDSPNHREATLKRFELIEQGEGLKDLFNKFDGKSLIRLQAERVIPKKPYLQRNRRLIGNLPAPTVTSHCLDEFIHPIEHRGLTIREVARLQSFPDWYQITGGPNLCPHQDFQQDKYEQLGDSVPPLMARAIGLELVEAIAPFALDDNSESVA